MAKCHGSLPDFHHNFAFPTAGLLDGNKTVICGGHLGYSDSGQCHTLGSRSTFATLKDSRMDTASIVLDDGHSLWITGGNQFPTGTLDTTELVSSDGSVTWGPKLPEKREDHCLVGINSTTVMLIGGSDKGGGLREFSDKTWFFNTGSKQWSRGPDLNTGRIIQSCGVLTDKGNGHQLVIVTGGWTADSATLNSTEILDLNGDRIHRWIYGPDLPKGLDRAPSVTAKNGTSFIVVGGAGSGFTYSSSFLELQCSNGDCYWTMMEHELATARCCGIALMIPDSMVTCH